MKPEHVIIGLVAYCIVLTLFIPITAERESSHCNAIIDKIIEVGKTNAQNIGAIQKIVNGNQIITEPLNDETAR